MGDNCQKMFKDFEKRPADDSSLFRNSRGILLPRSAGSVEPAETENNLEMFQSE